MRTPATEREPVVLVAQRLEAEKQTRLALEAWAISPLRHEGWELHVAGRGAEALTLRDHAVSLGVDVSVRFLGFVDDVHEQMSSASLLIATAPFEPFGLSVVEAMASGLPVVAAGSGAHAEVLQGFEDQLFASGSVHACATLLTRLGRDSDRRADVAARQLARYDEQYTIERHVDRLLDVYADAAG
jgi:glycosyltransferase involved in cell wall biosynthesis